MAATVWKGYLSFGLVSFPIRLFAAARPERVHFHMLHKTDLSRVKEVWYCIKEDKPVKRDDLVKGYEDDAGAYVVVEDAELKKIAPATATSMDILQFVKSGEIDPVFFETSYYVAPEDAASKPYTLLMTAMSETKSYAIAKATMHGREHLVVIRPGKDGMILHTLYYQDELHKSNAKAAPKSKFSAKEAALAKSLIESLAGPFKPEQYHDQYRANLERMIEEKRKGRKVTAVKQPAKTPVINILEALQRSLKAPRKSSRKVA